MLIKEEFLNKKFSFTGSFLEQRDKSLLLTSPIAERKAFLSKKTLTYRCRIKINEVEKKVYLYEILDEKSSGLTSGGDDEDFSTPGFGFKIEKYNTTDGTRRGTIEEAAILFGKQYKYTFDWKEIKTFAVEISKKFDYQLEFVLNEKLLQKK
jgi:hypothetical protein